MVHANLSIEAQNKFWAESMSYSNYYEDLVIKSGRSEPALQAWTGVDVSKWFKRLVEFGRIGIVNKRVKFSGKLAEKGYPAMMIGYAMNHGTGVYKVYNPKTN